MIALHGEAVKIGKVMEMTVGYQHSMDSHQAQKVAQTQRKSFFPMTNSDVDKASQDKGIKDHFPPQRSLPLQKYVFGGILELVEKITTVHFLFFTPDGNFCYCFSLERREQVFLVHKSLDLEKSYMC